MSDFDSNKDADTRRSSTDCSSVVLTVEAHRVPIGERIQAGDWWHYQAIGQFFQIEKPSRNWLGLRQKITCHHAPHYRVARVLKTPARVHGRIVSRFLIMKKRIRIPVLMGSNGEWSATGVRSGENPDWAMLGDFIDKNGEYPATERRYWVEAEIEVPSEEAEPVKGEVHLANANCGAVPGSDTETN